jgi:hypothetical protein
VKKLITTQRTRSSSACAPHRYFDRSTHTRATKSPYYCDMIRRRSRRRTIALVSAAIGVLAVVLPYNSARAARSELVPAPGSPLLYSIPAPPDVWPYKPVADVEVDSVNRRVFVSLPLLNAVEVFSLSATRIGTVTVASPGQLTLGENSVFVTSKTTGSILRINPVTLEKSTIASGMVSPNALTYQNASLFTIVETGPGWPDRAMVRVNPATGTKSIVNPTGVSAYDFENFFDPSPQTGELLGSAVAQSPSGFSRIDLGTNSGTRLHESYSCAAPLDDGEVLIGRGSEMFALNTKTMQESVRLWTPKENNMILGCVAANGIAVAVNAASWSNAASTVEVFEQSNPGRRIRTFSSTNTSVLPGLTRISSDGSLIVVSSKREANLEFYILPGATTGGATTASPPPTGGPRRATAAAQVVVNVKREPAKNSGFQAPVAMTAYDDWAVDSVGGHIFIMSRRDGVINVFKTDQTPVAAITNLASPSAILVCNGSVYVALAGTGKVVTINQSSWTVGDVVAGTSRPIRLVCAGGAVYASGPAANGLPYETALQRIVPGPSNVVPLPNYQTNFSAVGATNFLVGFQPYNYVRLNLGDQSQKIGTSFDSTYVTKPRFLHFYLGDAKFITSEGRRYDVATMEPDGFVFTGTPARTQNLNATVSQTAEPVVALMTSPVNFETYDGNDPAALLRQFVLNPGFELVDIEFGSGTRELFILVRRVSDGQIFPILAPNVVTG